MKKVLLSLIVVTLLLAAGFFLFNRSETSASVSTFEECEAAGYPVGESYPRQCFTPDGSNFVEEMDQVESEPGATSTPSTNEVTIRGAITCLPKIGTGPQTLECAMGLKATDGKNYGLRNLSESSPQFQFMNPNASVEVMGVVKQEVIKGPDGNRYDTAGVIYVSSIREI